MRFEPLKGALCAVVVRSPHAHARFRIADIAVARGGLPGVRLVLTAPGIAELGGLPRVAIPEGVKVDGPPYPVLARDGSSRISGTRFCIPGQDSRDTGWDRGYRWYCSQFSNFWWYRTVGPVGPPWKIADPRGQPWAHWSHLSVPPVRANSCGVPPVPSVPPKETVQRNEDGIANHDGSLSRMSAGIGRRGLKGRPRCGLDNTTISGHSRNYAHREHHGRITVARDFSRRG